VFVAHGDRGGRPAGRQDSWLFSSALGDLLRKENGVGSKGKKRKRKHIFSGGSGDNGKVDSMFEKVERVCELELQLRCQLQREYMQPLSRRCKEERGEKIADVPGAERSDPGHRDVCV
jgi:hypothetical protein